MAKKQQKGARYFNRELSWLEFNQRVLDEGRDESLPLLERLKFLAIASSNLDEFFMVRVGGLQRLVEQEDARTDPAGMTPARQLAAIYRRVTEMHGQQYACLLDEVEPSLANEGLRRVTPDGIEDKHLRVVRRLFLADLFPVFSPQAIRSDAPFPLLQNQTLHLCVRLAPAAEDPQEEENGDGEDHAVGRYAVIPLGPGLSRFITLPSEAEGGYNYILLEDVVQLCITKFFPGEEVLETATFRITRNADMSVREDLAADLLSGMEQVLDARLQSDCARLEIDAVAGDEMLQFLQSKLEIPAERVFRFPGPLALNELMKITGTAGFEHLQYRPWPPQPTPLLDPRKSLLDTLATQDVMLYHPYESFEPVIRLIEEAADDPDVLSIKQVLYRTSRDSPIIAALKRAAAQGKYVTALVELKARFDEARNIGWARDLEQSGVQVIYGVKGLKTHAKVCLIVRRESSGVQRYMHFGTGNYNESTAKLYSDVSIMTSRNDFGLDATAFFNAVSGYSQPQKLRQLEMAPTGLRDRFLEMIEVETQRAKQGHEAEIIAKVNSLVDTGIIDALYAASSAGVKIRLNIRGICCLRPRVKELSENIRVISIVDRFLEHARIFYFHHGGDQQVFISSADWMPRNLDRRVELMTPVLDVSNRNRLTRILKSYFKDNVKARELLASGDYRKVKPKARAAAYRSQERLYEEVCDNVRRAEQTKRTELEPHRGS